MKILPPSVDIIIQDYVSQLNKISSKNVVGVYLTGSAPLGDYYTHKSDIDFIAVTDDEPTNDLLHRLKNIHQSIEKRYNHPKLNGYYLTISRLANNELTFPSFFRNKLYLQRPFELKNFLYLN